MKPIERVKIIIEHYNLPISHFEKLTNMSNNSIQTAIKRNANLKDETLNSILNSFKEISAEWLLTGKGNMLKDEKSTVYKVDDDISNMAEKPASAYKEDNANEILGLLKDKITVLENSIAIMQENKAMQQDKIDTQAKEIAHLKQEITRLKSNSQNSEKTPSVLDDPMPSLPAGTRSKSRSHLRK